MNNQENRIPQGAVDLYTRYVDGEISRREFFAGVKRFAVLGLTAPVIIEALTPRESTAQVRDAAQAARSAAPPNAWTGLDPTYPIGMREFPKNDPDIPEIWIYSDRMSYSPGEEVVFYVHTNAPAYDLVIERDGGQVERVYEQTGLEGITQDTPDDACAVGCGWQESHRFRIPDSWTSGVYVATVTTELPDRGTAVGEHFIVVKNSRPGSASKIALMLSTSSYIAYNDWAEGMPTEVKVPIR